MTIQRSYKFLLLDQRDHLIEVKKISLESDEHARETAAALLTEFRPRKVEVYQTARFICIVDEKGTTPASNNNGTILT